MHERTIWRLHCGAQKGILVIKSPRLPVIHFLGQNYIVTEGNNFYYYPQSTTTKVIVVDAFYSWPAWTTGTTTDWWTENAEEFLIWQTLVEANRLPMQFVGGSEGNLPPPTKEANEALAKLVQAEKDSTEGDLFISDL